MPKSTVTRVVSFPSSHDWRDVGVVTAVKNQASCGTSFCFCDLTLCTGSCWDFTAVAVTEV